MGRLTVTALTSIDFVVEAPGGEPGYPHTNWVSRFPDRQQFDYKFHETEATDVLLLGRVTYESFAGAWPTYEGPFADKMNALPKVVVSTTLKDPQWNNTTVISTDVPAAIRRLKDATPGDIYVHGSRTLVQTLRRHDLVDRYRTMIFPIVLGSGFKLFDDGPDALQLKITEVERFDDAAVVVTYERDRSA